MFRVRPRVPRPPIQRGASLGLTGRQATQGLCTLAAQGGDLQAVGHQRTRGVVNLLTLVGRQVTRGLLTPDILCLGRQATRGQCALSGGAGLAFANGYGYRALVEVAPQPDLSGTVTNLVLRLTADVLAATALKTTGNGGKVQSTSGWDIRLEPYGAAVGAGKLDHQIVTAYGPTAGALDLRFRVPSWDVTTPYRLWLYAGKAGLSASEENAGGLWQGAMRATRLDTGADLSGGSRALTPSGVTAGGTLAGMPAGTYGTASYCRKTSPTYVPHLTAVTNEILFQLDAAPGAADSGDLDRVGGTPLSAETHSRYSSFVYQGGKVSAGANWYDSATGHQTNEGVETAAGVVGAALVHCMAVRQSGQATLIYVNGASVPVATLNPPVPAGAGVYLNVLAFDEDTVGAGQGFQPTALPGLYALDVQWPAALSAAFVAMRYRSEVECRSVAGMGGFDAFGDTDASPVAVPLRATNAGGQQDYDVVPGCFDPDGDPITLASVGASSHAGDTTSLTGGKVRYKPQPGWAGGTAEVPFAIGDGRGKAGSSRLWLAVRAPIVAVGNEGLAPPFPTSTATIKGPVAASAIQATYNALTASEIAGGVTILVTPGGTLTGGLTLGKSGAKGTGADDLHPQFPIIIRPGTLSGGSIVDPATFPAFTVQGVVGITGAYNWLRGCALRSGAAIGTAANNPRGARLNRCVANSSGNIADYGISTSVDWSEIGNVPGVLLAHYAQKGSRSPFTYRSWLHDGVGTASGNGTMEMLGTGNDADFVDHGGLALECLYGPPGDLSEGWESKSNFNVIRRCSILGSAGQSLRAIVRHGNNCEMDTLYCGTNSYAAFRGGPHVFADSTNIDSTPAYWGPYTGDMSYADWRTRAATALDMSSRYPNGVDVTFHRISKPTLGGTPSGVGLFDYPKPPTGSTLLSCTNLPPVVRDGTAYTTGTSTRPLPTKTARNWPVPTRAASDLIGPMGTYSVSD